MYQDVFWEQHVRYTERASYPLILLKQFKKVSQEKKQIVQRRSKQQEASCKWLNVIGAGKGKNGGVGHCKSFLTHTPKQIHTYFPITHLQPSFVTSDFSDDAWEIITFSIFVISKISWFKALVTGWQLQQPTTSFSMFNNQVIKVTCRATV